MKAGDVMIELSGYRPGALGRVTELHGAYYGENWGRDLAFEAEVAEELAEFLRRLDPARDSFWLAHRAGVAVGSIAIDGHGETGGEAHLRWFVVDPAAHGTGAGRALFTAAMAFCREAGYGRVVLWTFAGLAAARTFYDREGFQETETFERSSWGRSVSMQKLELDLWNSSADLRP